MTEPALVVCERVADVAVATVSFSAEACAHCREPIWLADSTREAMGKVQARGRDTKLLCIACAAPYFPGITLVVTTDRQQREVLAATGVEHVARSFAAGVGAELVNLDEDDR